ncbi:DUF2673 domain-containing protein [Rickettsia endosymbiont of Polydrusus tereticollis]|uniref:DUF2673 domain-containing protein n=1 Tax=Rickettsia endosymbiont of Polydrusus tereticollis TaxID=3066251 RepID=UPI003133278A|nr:DUF2673 domain-containing protein [Rickettsia endosymbiont of Oxypoda opaca]
MKNLLKVLLVLAFSTSAFADMVKMPAPEAVTTDSIMQMNTADQKSWVDSLTSDQYNMLSADVQKWVMDNTTPEQKTKLGLSQ